MGKNVYALIVGIDQYPDPKDRLSGAVADTQKIIRFLEQGIPKDKLLLASLLNEQATYRNFINTFRSHLGKAGKDDVVWFHYSGHGARQATATEMEPYTSGNMDETLVLVDSRQGGHDLADKELSLLLQEVAAGGAHIMVTLDCCHSGSGTRDIDDAAPQYKLRQAGERTDKRGLETYLDGYFVQHGFIFPNPKHLLLAACNRFQTAKETYTSSGIFTENLVNALAKTGMNVSYADLFIKLRQGVYSYAIMDQDPQMELMGDFDGYTRFLDGSPAGSASKFPVYRLNKEWIIEAGALHGLNPTGDAGIPVEIYSGEEGSEALVTKAKITSVSFQRAVLLPEDVLDESRSYLALAKGLHLPTDKVLIENEGMDASDAITDMSEFPGLAMATADDKAEDAAVRIRRGSGRLELWDNLNNTLVAQANPVRDNSFGKMLQLAKQVANWYKLGSMQNQESAIGPGGCVILMSIKNSDGSATIYPAGHISLVQQGKVFPYEIRVQNLLKQPIHYCLLYVSGDYGVSILKNEPIEPSETPLQFWGGGTDDYLFMDEGKSAVTETLFAIISTERIDDFELRMEGIKPGANLSALDESTRGIAGINKPSVIRGAWFTQKFSVHITAGKE